MSPGQDSVTARSSHTGSKRAATIAVVTNDGRNIVGVLRGYDQQTNMILDECHERVYSMQARRQCPDTLLMITFVRQ